MFQEAFIMKNEDDEIHKYSFGRAPLSIRIITLAVVLISLGALVLWAFDVRK